ncbi:MAG: CBS domain-containing protein [Sphingobacteriales bacterium]|jgi:acetoin utilization protein AcuB
MFCGQIISSPYKPLQLVDTVAQALSVMENAQITHLPVVDEDRYLGMIDENDLLDVPSDTMLKDLSDRLVIISVKSSDYFLVAVKLSHVYDLSLVPVANEKQEYEGLIERTQLFHNLAQLTGADEYGSMIVLEMEKKDYALGLLNRLVESNDALITQLNTWSDPATQLMTVVLRINKEEVSDVVSSFQRHEYTVRYYLGEELFRNELQSNLDHLLNYLNI